MRNSHNAAMMISAPAASTWTHTLEAEPHDAFSMEAIQRLADAPRDGSGPRLSDEQAVGMVQIDAQVDQLGPGRESTLKNPENKGLFSYLKAIRDCWHFSMTLLDSVLASFLVTAQIENGFRQAKPSSGV